MDQCPVTLVTDTEGYVLQECPGVERMERSMKVTTECCVVRAVATALLFIPALGFAKDAKTYKHASEYQVAILDQNLRVETGNDVTLGKNTTDAKLGPGGQGIHLLHTDAGTTV